MTRQCSTTDSSVLEGPKSMQPCFAMSSHPVRFLEPSEHFVLHIAAPFLQGIHGCPTQTSRAALAWHFSPAQQFPRAGSVTACGSRHGGTAFLFEGIQQLARATDAWKAVLGCWRISGTTKLPELDGICLMLYNTIDQQGNQEERKWNHATFLYLAPSFPR